MSTGADGETNGDGTVRPGGGPEQFPLTLAGLETALAIDAAAAEADCMRRYERVIGRLAGFIQIKAPRDARLPTSTDEALMAGIVGLVGDHIRIGRVDRLEDLRPELVLLTPGSGGK